MSSSDVIKPKGESKRVTMQIDADAERSSSVMWSRESQVTETAEVSGRKMRIVTTPSFDLYYPVQRAVPDDRQADTRLSRVSLSLEAPPRIPVDGDPRPNVEPPRSVGERRRGIQDQRSKTVTFTENLAGTLEQCVRRLRRMPTPFWQRKDIKTQQPESGEATPQEGKSFDNDDADSPYNGRTPSGCGSSVNSSSTASGRNSSESTPIAGRSAGSSPSRTLSVRGPEGGVKSADQTPPKSPQPRKGSLPTSNFTRQLPSDGRLALPTNHSIDYFA